MIDQSQDSKTGQESMVLSTKSPISRPLRHSTTMTGPCAVCRVALRGSMIMIPARMTCPSGWTREYFGYLMSTRHDLRRTEFICFDRNLEAVGGTHESEAGSVIFPVEVRCLDPDPDSYRGGLPCDKFPEGKRVIMCCLYQMIPHT